MLLDIDANHASTPALNCLWLNAQITMQSQHETWWPVNTCKQQNRVLVVGSSIKAKCAIRRKPASKSSILGLQTFSSYKTDRSGHSLQISIWTDAMRSNHRYQMVGSDGTVRWQVRNQCEHKTLAPDLCITFHNWRVKGFGAIEETLDFIPAEYVECTKDLNIESSSLQALQAL